MTLGVQVVGVAVFPYAAETLLSAVDMLDLVPDVEVRRGTHYPHVSMSNTM